MSTETLQVAGNEVKLGKFDGVKDEVIVRTFLNFIDAANTSTDRATAYNTKTEQKNATDAIHKNLYSIDRGAYAATLLLDGVTEHTKKTGIRNILSNVGDPKSSMIDIDTESKIVAYLVQKLKPTDMLRLYEELKSSRINNSRTKRIIMLSLLNSSNLDYWAVKYRKKVKNAITHALGLRTSSIVSSIIKKKREDWNAKEQTIVQKQLLDYVNTNTNDYVIQCLNFIFDNNFEYTFGTIKSFIDARHDLSKGSKLPREVLEGIRSTYHKKVSPDEVLKLTKQNLTEKEKMQVQKSAKAKGIKIDFDPTKQEVVSLYIHAYANNGIDDTIKEALEQKAKREANNSPLVYDKVGIVFDASGSSSGDSTQHLRPIAISSSIRDMLIKASDSNIVEYAGGYIKNGLVFPEGETNLAKALVNVVKQKPNAIFILSDGYENAPAGRVNEVIEALEKIGINIPIYHINPVTSAEASGVRSLSPKLSVIPANKPSSLGLGMIKAMLETNLQEGIVGLFNITLPKLSNSKKLNK